MIAIEKAERFRSCNVCYSNDDVYEVTFYYGKTRSGNQVALCQNCLLELKDRIDCVLWGKNIKRSEDE